MTKQDILRIAMAQSACDIGCDHAYAAIELIKKQKAKKVIACDINAGPLKSAERNVKDAGLSDKIDIRLGDGLSPVHKGEAETVICAGMGGPLICHILEDRTEDIRYFVLSPQSERESLRHFLVENGVEILEEEMLKEDGKYYVIILGEKKNDASDDRKDHRLTEAEYIYGWKLLEKKDPILYEYLLKEKVRFQGILKQTDKAEIRKSYDYCMEALGFFESSRK